ncbi:hypothetical protein ULG90_03170 [Halopseudomonas pachastrellae]|nr:hypothetical protein ULG90_03170 [Halopseudomonas pachastrellae]
MAEDAYRRAIELDPYFIAAYVNLADLYRASFRDPDAERLLQTGYNSCPQAAPLHFSLGLLKVRSKQMDQALTALRQAVSLDRTPAAIAMCLPWPSTAPVSEPTPWLSWKRAWLIPNSQTLLTLRQQLQTGQP